MIVRTALATLLVFLLVIVGAPGLVRAQDAKLSACKDATREDYGAFGGGYRPSSCQSEFLVSDPYLVLFAEVGLLYRDTKIAIELLDPEGATAFQTAGMLSTTAGERTRFTIAIVLPLSATATEVKRKFPTFIVITLGRPARERLGEWVWKVLLDPGVDGILKFTLKAPQSRLPSLRSLSAPTVTGSTELIAKHESVAMAYWRALAIPTTATVMAVGKLSSCLYM